MVVEKKKINATTTIILLGSMFIILGLIFLSSNEVVTRTLLLGGMLALYCILYILLDTHKAQLIGPGLLYLGLVVAINLNPGLLHFEIQDNTDPVLLIGFILVSVSPILGLFASSSTNSLIAYADDKSRSLARTNTNLSEILTQCRELTSKLSAITNQFNSSIQEQQNASVQQVSGITEVSATIEELSISAQQITRNTAQLVESSKEMVKALLEDKKVLEDTLSQLHEVGDLSRQNSQAIENLGSAHNVEKAALDIEDLLANIITSSEMEHNKVVESEKTVATMFSQLEQIVTNIEKNYSFTQEINTSVSQQENGSHEAAQTMQQMSEISRQTNDNIQETAAGVREIVDLIQGLDQTINKVDILPPS